MNERRDVHSSLAEMDRKLRELQHELAAVSQPPEPAAAPPPPAAVPGTPFAPAGTAPFPAGPHVPAAPAPVPPAAYQPAAPSPFPASAPAPAPAPPPAAAPADPANEDAARILEDATARLVAMSRQIDELQRGRHDLQRSIHALAAHYGRLPVEGTRQAGPPATQMPRPAYAPGVASPPGMPEAEAAVMSAPQPADVRPLGPGSPAFPPPVAGAPAVSGMSPPPEGAANRNQFEGQVVVNAGPFTDIATLGAFEQALGRLPRAEEVYVRGFEGNRALIDLRLGGPIRLLEEMRRAVPFPFGVVEVGHGMVTINVDAPAGNQNPAMPLRQ